MLTREERWRIVIGKNILAGWFSTGVKRNLSGTHLLLFSLMALSLAVFQVWSVIFGKLDPLNQMAIHLSFILALTFLVYSYSRKVTDKKYLIFADYFAALLAIAAGGYYTIHAERIATRIPVIEPLSTVDVFFGLVFVVLTLEAARRTIGFLVVLIVLVGISYMIWGHHLSGVLSHREFSLVEILDDLAYSFNGLWGSPVAVAASFVFMFMLFGSFLNKAGAGDFFFQLSSAIAGRSKGGAAKVAVLASAFFGSISGSPTANVVTTGAFTIPVSKKIGYKSSFAAAIEAAASTGGSILPPIMGSSAFLMAAVTQLPYRSIIIAAFIPAILYYISLLAMVHFEALRLDLPRVSKEDIPKLSSILKEGWHYFLPLIVLVFFLVEGYSPSRTAFYGMITIIIISWFRKCTRMGLREIIAALIDGAKSAIPVTTACAAAGLVIAGIMSTGLGGKLTSIVLALTEGHLLFTLILVMVICIILGMGMPVAAAYILTAMLAAPALIELGVPTIAAHLFIVYFSIFSAITPPVAVAAFAAAGIADTSPNKVGFEAARLGLVGFIVPFMFVLEPTLLMKGELLAIVLSFFTASFGVIVLAAALIGWFSVRISVMKRILLGLSALVMIYPHFLSDVLGLVAIIIMGLVVNKSKLSFNKKLNQAKVNGVKL